MMARLAKFSDAMSSMDVNCVLRDASMAARVSIRRARAPRRRVDGVEGVDASTRTRLDTEGPLARRLFRTRRACLAPLLLGDELRHLAVDLLEGLKPRVGLYHSSHPVVAASFEHQ